jgi:hypothetical protein
MKVSITAFQKTLVAILGEFLRALIIFDVGLVQMHKFNDVLALPNMAASLNQVSNSVPSIKIP